MMWRRICNIITPVRAIQSRILNHMMQPIEPEEPFSVGCHGYIHLTLLEKTEHLVFSKMEQDIHVMQFQIDYSRDNFQTV